VDPSELAHCTNIYRARHPELTSFEPNRLQAPEPLRLYRAYTLEASVLLADDGPDIRIPIDLPIRSSADR